MITSPAQLFSIIALFVRSQFHPRARLDALVLRLNKLMIVWHAHGRARGGEVNLNENGRSDETAEGSVHILANAQCETVSVSAKRRKYGLRPLRLNKLVNLKTSSRLLNIPSTICLFSPSIYSMHRNHEARRQALELKAGISDAPSG